MLISRSFLRGFGRGLAAPGMLFEPFRIESAGRFDASVENAWKEAGRFLNDATAQEGTNIGKKARNAGEARRRHKSPA